MALKGNWDNLVDGESEVRVEPINRIAAAVIENEEKILEITENGGNITVDDALSDTSENPVQNKVIAAELDKKASKNGHAAFATLEVTSFSRQNGVVVGSIPNAIHTDDGEPLDFFNTVLSNIGAPTNDMDAANKAYVDKIVGDIEIALDSIISIQNELIGGGTE